MPTSPQSNPNNVSVIDSVIDALTQHLLQVINHLQQDDEIAPSFDLLLISEPEVTERLITPIQTVYPEINITNYSTNDFLQADYDRRYTLGCFIDSQLFHNQITESHTLENQALDNQNLENQNKKNQWSQKSSSTASQQQAIANQQQTANQQRQLIAIRLRDLFAQQSVMFLAKPFTMKTTQKHPSLRERNDFTVFSELGYIAAPISVTSAPNNTHSAQTNSAQTQISCWQFNLYDYKARPDWLNAKYWANPENFDKYRW